jgi:hypothetical protein
MNVRELIKPWWPCAQGIFSFADLLFKFRPLQQK